MKSKKKKKKRIGFKMGSHLSNHPLKCQPDSGSFHRPYPQTVVYINKTPSLELLSYKPNSKIGIEKREEEEEEGGGGEREREIPI